MPLTRLLQTTFAVFLIAISLIPTWASAEKTIHRASEGASLAQSPQKTRQTTEPTATATGARTNAPLRAAKDRPPRRAKAHTASPRPARKTAARAANHLSAASAKGQAPAKANAVEKARKAKQGLNTNTAAASAAGSTAVAITTSFATDTARPGPLLAIKTSARMPRQETGPAYATRADAMRFADDVADRRGLDRAWVRQAIGQANLLPVVVRLMAPSPAGTPKNWRAYRGRFIDAYRINAGTAFWEVNQPWLEKAEREFGVPAEIIVGIVGVETIYGQQTGHFRVMDALTTLAFDFPASHPRATERTAYFRGELEQALSLAHRSGLDPLSLKGSYAGAMGWPQFMPSSWQQHAIDYDRDGKVDLFDSQADVIGSVANYFKAYGWERGLPTHYPVNLDTTRLDKDALLAPDILPTFSVASFTAKGGVLDFPGLGHSGLLALVELQNGADVPSYVAGTQNFYVITRYNQSSYYAMAVIELGREVKAAMNR